MLDNEGKPYIELNVFLKIKGFAQTGGQAKILIRSEKVKVNGTMDTTNKRKLRSGDVVEIDGKKLKVELNGEEVV